MHIYIPSQRRAPGLQERRFIVTTAARRRRRQDASAAAANGVIGAEAREAGPGATFLAAWETWLRARPGKPSPFSLKAGTLYGGHGGQAGRGPGSRLGGRLLEGELQSPGFSGVGASKPGSRDTPRDKTGECSEGSQLPGGYPDPGAGEGRSWRRTLTETRSRDVGVEGNAVRS